MATHLRFLLPLGIALLGCRFVVFGGETEISANWRFQMDAVDLGEKEPRNFRCNGQTPPSRLRYSVQTGEAAGADRDSICHCQIQSSRLMGFRACLGVIRLAKAVGAPRMEAACRRALHFGTCSYPSVDFHGIGIG